MNDIIPVNLIENPGGLADCPGYKTAGIAAFRGRQIAAKQLAVAAARTPSLHPC